MSPRVGAAGPLSRERIAKAAISVADETGLESMSMKSVAEQLGAGTMSLYRHVRDRDELVAAMVEKVSEEYAYPDRSELDWRRAMHALARQDWTAILAHPWMLSATASVTPPFGVVHLASMEWALAALEELDLPPLSAARIVMTISSYVQGSARMLLGEKQPGAGDDPGRNWQHRLADADLSDFPRLHDLIGQPLPEGERDWFAEGLDVILDGVEHAAGAGALGPDRG